MKIDHIHFYVEDALASRDWFVKFMGFQSLASVASRHTRTTLVRSGKVYIVLSSPLTTDSPVAEFLRRHPPGVADIAFVVSDVKGVIAQLVQQGAKVLQPIQEHYFAEGWLKWGKIAAWGALSHTILERRGMSQILAIPAQVDGLIDATDGEVPPIFPNQEENPSSTIFTGIDHVVLNVAAGDLVQAVQWYQDVLGFQPQQMFAIQTEQSGLCSQVMVHPATGVQLPINEPTSANSQIQEFLEMNGGPGIQHIALAADNIVEAIAQLRHWGLSFLKVPSSYYTQLQQRPHRGNLPTPQWQDIAAQQILVDWQKESPQALLLQTFTQPIFSKPTFFFEVIERRLRAKGFGEGNFRALFKAIEREQLKRGSLKIN